MIEKNKRSIAILGSTGSVGRQALEVISEHQQLFEVEVLTAQNNVDLLIKQTRQHLPNAVVIGNEQHYPAVKEGLADLPVKVYAGQQALIDIVELANIDIVLTAMVGISGLEPTIRAIQQGKAIALANKETLVVAGHLIMKLAAENRTPILPVDSEHSAIFQCLVGEQGNMLEKIYLTASGGPFRGMSREDMMKVTKAQALRHPCWDMGKKITIDSATMMNKGLEVIEAQWLFGLKPEQVNVVIHPQSIIHSMVMFEDGSMKAQMGLPDMKLPIQYALGFPQRLRSDLERFSFLDYPQLTFEAADTEAFPCLQLAYDAMRKGGNTPCIMNAANEMAVEAFLNNEIRFLEIAEVINHAMTNVGHHDQPDIKMILQTDHEAREKSLEMINQMKK